MKAHFKNSVILLLLLAVMAPISFAFLSYHVQLKLIKREVKQQLIQETNKEDLVSLSFDMNSELFKSLHWEHDREFEFNQKMFDIVEVDTIGDTIHYLCFPDKQETALNLAFNKKLEDRYANDTPSKNRAHQMHSLIYGLYFIPQELDNQNYTAYTSCQYAAYHFSYQSIGLDLTAPPPQDFI